MFVSLLLPFEAWGWGARHLAIFYRQLAGFQPDEIAFVGPRDYFRDPLEHEADGRPEWQAASRNALGYTPPDSLAGVRYAALPEGLLDANVRQHQSPLKTYRDLLTRRLPVLETAIAEALDAVASTRPEGILSLLDIPSVRAIADARGIPYIHQELGPVRGPSYAMTGYWDRRVTNRRVDAARRFQQFRRELRRASLPLRNLDELRRSLRHTRFPDVTAAADAPYRIGVALQGEEDSYASGIGALDLLTLAGRYARGHELLIRHHPTGLARYSDSLGVIDTSRSPTDFVLQCETVLSANSGTALEALLLGRRCVVLGDSPFAIAADRTMDRVRQRDAHQQLLALNFLIFGYLTPFDFLFDAEYARWRLTNPPELEIFERHQRWYDERHPHPDGPSPLHDGTLDWFTRLSTTSPRPSLFVFGAGQHTSSLIRSEALRRFTLLGVFDNNETKWGARIGTLPIEQPRYHDDALVVVASDTHGDAIATQLRTLGYASERILRPPFNGSADR